LTSGEAEEGVRENQHREEDLHRAQRQEGSNPNQQFQVGVEIRGSMGTCKGETLVEGDITGMEARGTVYRADADWSRW
jgi:hypothetical protein